MNNVMHLEQTLHFPLSPDMHHLLALMSRMPSPPGSSHMIASFFRETRIAVEGGGEFGIRPANKRNLSSVGTPRPKEVVVGVGGQACIIPDLPLPLSSFYALVPQGGVRC